jgi:hypothetical protein
MPAPRNLNNEKVRHPIDTEPLLPISGVIGLIIQKLSSEILPVGRNSRYGNKNPHKGLFRFRKIDRRKRPTSRHLRDKIAPMKHNIHYRHVRLALSYKQLATEII